MSQELLEYLDEFGVSMRELRPDQLAMFVAARNLAHYVEDLEVPIGSGLREENDASLTERETQETLDDAAYVSDPLEWHLPADEMEVSLVRSTEDLPRIFPVQWLLEATWPDAFYAKLAQRELLMPEWQRPTRGSQEGWDETKQSELAEKEATAQAARRHLYVLLDTSRTMRDHDRRGIVARGLALACLLKGHQQRVRIHLRPFTSTAGELLSGSSEEEFRAIVRKLIELPNSGQTRIQAALKQAVEDIRGEGPCLGAGIVLVTDGISRLSKKPLARERLYTFILGDMLGSEGASKTIATLEEWSYRFRRIWKNRFAEIVAPTPQDCASIGELLHAAVHDGTEDGPENRAGEPDGLLENASFLVREFKRLLGKGAPLSAEVQSLEMQVKDAELRRRSGVEPTRPAFARHRSASGRSSMPGGWAAVNPGELLRRVARLWEHIARLAVQLWQRVRKPPIATGSASALSTQALRKPMAPTEPVAPDISPTDSSSDGNGRAATGRPDAPKRESPRSGP